MYHKASGAMAGMWGFQQPCYRHARASELAHSDDQATSQPESSHPSHSCPSRYQRQWKDATVLCFFNTFLTKPFSLKAHSAPTPGITQSVQRSCSIVLTQKPVSNAVLGCTSLVPDHSVCAASHPFQGCSVLRCTGLGSSNFSAPQKPFWKAHYCFGGPAAEARVYTS